MRRRMCHRTHRQVVEITKERRVGLGSTPKSDLLRAGGALVVPAALAGGAITALRVALDGSDVRRVTEPVSSITFDCSIPLALHKVILTFEPTGTATSYTDDDGIATFSDAPSKEARFTAELASLLVKRAFVVPVRSRLLTARAVRGALDPLESRLRACLPLERATVELVIDRGAVWVFRGDPASAVVQCVDRVLESAVIPSSRKVRLHHTINRPARAAVARPARAAVPAPRPRVDPCPAWRRELAAAKTADAKMALVKRRPDGC